MTRKAFTVVWDQDLQDDLASFWIESSTEVRSQIATACDEIDIVLATVPDSVGRSWQGSSDQFVWSLPGYPFSLVAIYQVSRDDRIVKVFRLHIAER